MTPIRPLPMLHSFSTITNIKEGFDITATKVCFLEESITTVWNATRMVNGRVSRSLVDVKVSAMYNVKVSAIGQNHALPLKPK